MKLTVLTLAFAQMASAATTYYVTTNGTGNLSGSDWANATNNLQGAIDAIAPGAANTVWVSNGVYEVGGVTNYPTGTVLTNRVAIWQAITVRSANNDPTNTIIKGAGPSGPAAVRCVYMTNGASLIGFMLTNGATLASGTANDTYGGGVWCPSISATISNCVIAGNMAARNGSGAHYGTLYNCTLITNVAGGYGGGAYYGNLYNCGLYNNRATELGGGAFGGVQSSCTLVGNWGGWAAGGAIYSTMYNCTIVSNSADGGGGGVYHGNLYNCLLTGNRAGGTGGGAYGQWSQGTWVLYNCTIVGNYSAASGGGASEIILYNCIVYFNDAPTGSNYYDSTNVNCCTMPIPVTGAGNISDNPLLINKGSGYGINHVAGNYRLSANSPCVNAGTNGSWTTSYPYDLDGRARIRYGTVDMGAYEKIYEGTIYSFH